MGAPLRNYICIHRPSHPRKPLRQVILIVVVVVVGVVALLVLVLKVVGAIEGGSTNFHNQLLVMGRGLMVLVGGSRSKGNGVQRPVHTPMRWQRRKWRGEDVQQTSALANRIHWFLERWQHCRPQHGSLQWG